MKIIFIIDSLSSGGAERVMSTVAIYFAKNGHDITIISKSHKPAFYKLGTNINLVYPKTKINYKSIFTTFLSRLNIYKDIYKILKKEKPNIVISFSTTTNGVIIPICKMLSVRVIVSEHTNYKVKNLSLTRWFIKRHIYPLASMLTVLTERDKKEYYSKFMKNVFVMPNPLPIKPVETVNFEQREKIILAVGNLYRWKIKGFDNLLKIFSSIANYYPGWDLHIAGGGDSLYMQSMITEAKLGKRVTLLGEVKDIQNIMQKSSIFVLTSRWEGLPMALLEALSQGMACIAFDCFTGPRELISNEIDGIIVADQNNIEFSKKLSMLIENDKLRIKLGRNAIETSKNYLPEKIIKMWQNIIEQTKNP